MNEYRKISCFDIWPDRETVLCLIECYKDSELYHKITKEYSKLEEIFRQSVHPQVFYKFAAASKETVARSEGRIEEGTRIIYLLMTIGDEIDAVIRTNFDNGAYLKGLLLNAMADAYLFLLDDEMTEILKENCLERNLFITGRLEAPTDVPMHIQKVILDEIREKEDLVIALTEGYMFTPLKTMAYILLLTEDQTGTYSGHNCNTCPFVNCRLRKKLKAELNIL